MASRYVRDTVRTWLGLGSIPFYDTVNQSQNPQDAMWCSVDWGYSFVERMTFCDEKLEEGAFQVVFFGPVGEGDTNLLTAAESEMDLLMTRLDGSNRLELKGYAAAEDFSDENFYAASFNVEYEYARP